MGSPEGDEAELSVRAVVLATVVSWAPETSNSLGVGDDSSIDGILVIGKRDDPGNVIGKSHEERGARLKSRVRERTLAAEYGNDTVRRLGPSVYP